MPRKTPKTQEIPSTAGTLISANLADQMKQDYGDYAMAVLLGRAIPDLYDGLKPAARRILQTMWEEGLLPDKKFVKCARVTGLTLAYYHPQGSCYGTLVNMATDWNNNVPWVNGHGNFGSSVDGPAAERYTEAKLRPSAVDILLQDKATWETRPNYDGSRQEAIRFNTALPTILLNGDAGIAVGFATTLAPHNLRDVVKATELACKFGNDKEVNANRKKARELLLPDFPTGCDIVNDEQLLNYTQTGSGSIRCRARYETSIEKRDGRAKDRGVVTFTNLPPRINPEKLGEQIKDALDKGKIDGIAEVRDESDLSGDRISVIAKPGVDAEQLAQQLFATTDLDSKYPAKTLVIDGTRPVELSPVEICQKWFSWRMDCLERKFRHERDIAEARLEIVEGFLKAIKIIDKVIKIIRSSPSAKEALTTLVTDRTLKFTGDQARAILEMKLRQLTGLDQTELEAEKEQLEELLVDLNDLIDQPTSRAVRLYKVMAELAKRHGEARRSALIEPPAGFTKVTSSGATKRDQAPRGAKPRFMLVDQKKGIVSQAKGPRGALVLDQKDKVIFFTQDGLLRKVPATFKGPVGESYTPVILAKRETEVALRKYLCVFKLGEMLKAIVFEGESLCKVTSKGKSAIPDGAELVHFDEKPFTVTFASKRKKPIELTLASVKLGKPGGTGTKIANLCDLAE
jgi:DNA gyrase subunit A